MKSLKWLSIVLVAVMLLSSFGSAFAQAPAPEPWLKKWDGVKLVLSSHTGPTTDAVKILAKDFETLTGAQVQVIDESWTDLLSKHLAAFAANTGAYDIVTWPYLWMGHYAEGGMVEDLNTWFAKTDLVDPDYDLKDIIPSVLEEYGRYKVGFAKDPNALWAVPYKFDIYLAQYRPSMFKGAGIVDAQGNAKPPETWEELTADAKLIAAKYPDVKPVVFPLNGDDCMDSTFLPIFCSYGGSIPMPWMDANLYPEFQKKPGLDAALALKGLLPYMPKDAFDMDYDKVNQYMSQGLAAYAENWNAYLPTLLDKTKSKIADDVAFDLVPGGPNGRPQGLGGWTMGISSQSKNKEAAFQLLQYISGKNRGPKLALSGGSVARYSTAQDPEVAKAFPYYPLLLKALDKVAIRGMDRSWAEVQRTIGVGLAKVLQSPDADAQKILTDTAGQVFDQVKAAGYTPEKTAARP